MRNDEDALSAMEELEEGKKLARVGAPSVFELYVGVSLSLKPSAEKEKILGAIRSLSPLPLDSASAARAGQVFGGMEREGARIDPEDAMLAGIALENGLPLLTRNRKHFAGIPGLKVESY
jgi:tRNA(fMet)-specific endonuclease VapC